jgi:hypothetical protein
MTITVQDYNQAMKTQGMIFKKDAGGDFKK